MAVSTREVGRALQTELGPVGAKSLQDWLDQQYDFLAALAAKMDADDGITDTDFADTLATYLTE